MKYYFNFLIILFFQTTVFSQAPQLVLPVGHSGRIVDVAIDNSGKYAVTGGDDQVVILWDLEKGKIIKRFTGFYHPILCVEIDPNLKYIAVGTKSKLVWEGSGETVESAYLLNISTGELEYSFTGLPYETKDITFSPDGKKIALGSTEWLYQFDVDSKKLILKYVAGKDNLLSTEYVDCITYSNDGKRLIVNFKKGPAIWDANTGKLISKMKFHDYSIFDMALSTNGRYLATSGTDRKLAIWDLNTETVVTHFTSGNWLFNKITFSSDNRYLAYSLMNYEGSMIEVFDLTTNKKVLSLSGSRGEYAGIKFIDNDKHLVVVGAANFKNSVINKINLETGKKTSTFQANFNGEEWMSLESFPNEPAFIAGGVNGLLVKWNLKTIRPDYIHQTSKAMVSTIAIDSLNNLVFAGFNDGLIYTYNSSTGQGLGQFGNYHSSPISSGISSDERFAVTAGAGVSDFAPKGISTISLSNTNKLITGTYTGEVKISNINNSKKSSIIQEGNTTEEISAYSKMLKSYNGGIITSVGFQKNTNNYAYSYQKRVDIVTTNTGINIIYNGRTHSIKNKTGKIKFSPNGAHLLFSYRSNIFVYDLKKETIITSFKVFDDPILDIEYNHEGNRFAVVGRSQKIAIYDANRYKLFYKTQAHNANITGVKFSMDDKYLITSSRDYTCRVWNAKSGKELAVFYTFNKNEWIVTTPDGYYFSTKNATKKLQYTINLDVYPFEQFDLKYNRPDIILDRLGYTDSTLVKAYHYAYLKRLKKMGFTEEMLKDDFHLPEIKIENFEDMPTINDQGSIDIKLNLKDSKYKLDRINVWVNDVAIYGINGISLRDKNIQNYTTTLSVNLAKGNNKIQVSVLNQAGAESYKETFEIECTVGKDKPNLYLITIGESKFKQSNYNLTYAAKDANDMATLFNKSKAYETVYTKTLVNEQVTKENILALRSFLEQADINDQVMVFIAGHGVLDANLDYFFATYDMDFTNPSDKGLAYDDLEGLLDGIKPLKKTLIIDACHSGEIDKDEVKLAQNNVNEEGDIQFRAVGNSVKPKLGIQNTSELTKLLFTDLRKGTGATVISSAGGMEFAMESAEWNNGLFTYCLLNGITSGDADLNQDGEIWLSELQQYVGEQVTLLSNGKQQPTSRIENQVVDFRVW